MPASAVGGAGDTPPPPLPTPTPTVLMRDSDLGGSGSKKGIREGGGLPPLPLLSSFDDDISEATKNDAGNDDGSDVFLGLSQGKGRVRREGEGRFCALLCKFCSLLSFDLMSLLWAYACLCYALQQLCGSVT